MARSLAALLILVFCVGAHADVTINNFQSATVANNNMVLHYDTDGNTIDAHDGNMLQCVTGMPNCTPGTIYMYGTAYNCGFDWGVHGPWCGFRMYETTDLKVWKNDGLIFDPTSWQASCAPNGCDRPRMIYNAANNNYVFWFNILSGSGAHYRVYTCSTPTSGCTYTGQPTGILHPAGGDEFLFLDPATGNGYIAYSSGSGGSSEVYVQQLNSSFTDATSSISDANMLGEGVAMFTDGTNYYVMSGPACPYCGSVATNYTVASSPLGTYSAPTQLSSNTCLGQSNSVDVITAGGHTTQLFRADQWIAPNQAPSSQYFEPLTTSAGVITPITCAQTVTVQGLTSSGSNAAPGSPDQTSFTDDYVAQCGVQSGQYWFFTFKPTTTPLANVGIATGQWPNGGDANASLTVDLTTVSGTNAPGTVLATGTLTTSAALYNPNFLLFHLGYAVTPGTTYGISLHSTMTNGCFLVMQSNASQYANGLVSKSTNSGASYTTISNSSVLFATYGPATVPGGWFPFR